MKKWKVIGIREAELEQLITQYEKLVYTVCYSFVKNPFDAEDLAQDTFMAAFKHFAAFDGANPKAWLTRIAANKCRDYLKSAARKTAPDETALASAADPAPTPEEAAIHSDSEERMRTLCESLKEPYKEVALAYFCQGENLSRLAAATGTPVKTMQTRLYRAKQMLKDRWKEAVP